MQTNFISSLFRAIFAKLKGALWKWWYQYLAKSYKKQEWKFMNYGYAPLDENPEMVALDTADADNRYCIQLYHHVASAVDLTGLEALEIGSGRGGGADYIKRYLKPQRMIGVDFAKDAVEFCNQNYSVAGLSFKVGDAQALPFADNSFDAVINVESSHCYPSMEAFLGQVKRVLRDGGHFLFADLRSKESVDVLREQLRNSGLKVIKETNITPNVVRALKLDNDHRTTLIKSMIRKSMVKTFLKFAGAEDSDINIKLKNGETIYTSCVLQKSNV
jgi:ubiquinone/menaquinone biosynthesis C-methylase UbiE